MAFLAIIFTVLIFFSDSILDGLQFNQSMIGLLIILLVSCLPIFVINVKGKLIGGNANLSKQALTQFTEVEKKGIYNDRKMFMR